VSFVSNRIFIKREYLLQKNLGENIVLCIDNSWSMLFGMFKITQYILGLRCAQKTVLEMSKTS